MRKPIIPLIVVIVSLVGLTLYFDVFRKQEKNPHILEGSGTIEVTEIDIASKIMARIADVTVKEGDEVKKGDILVRLEGEELSAQEKSAIANYENALANYKRAKELYEAGSLPTRDFEAISTTYQIARANLDIATLSAKNTIIRAPIDGYIVSRNLHPGEIAFPGSAILTLADLTHCWIKIYIPETKLGLVKIGQRAEISVDSFPNKKYEGKVIYISPKAEFTPKTVQTKEERVKLMFAIKIELPNPHLELKAGMPADAKIFLVSEKP
ncbi:MAG: efflux RND transporter periplasmic adaptor subunit [Brevinematales bacterium]|nr:efflux RND transporter periplasmic adaptor subunit [Brevinematales bacterium]